MRDWTDRFMLTFAAVIILGVIALFAAWGCAPQPMEPNSWQANLAYQMGSPCPPDNPNDCVSAGYIPPGAFDRPVPAQLRCVPLGMGATRCFEE